MSCLYILEINPLSVDSFANIFSHSEGCLFDFSHSTECAIISHCSLNYISLMISDVEHLFMHFLIIQKFSFLKYLIESFAFFFKQKTAYEIQV